MSIPRLLGIGSQSIALSQKKLVLWSKQRISSVVLTKHSKILEILKKMRLKK